MRADHRGMAADAAASKGRKQGCPPEISAAAGSYAAVSTRRLSMAGRPS